MQALLTLRAQNTFAPADVEKIVIEVADKVLSHHADPAPRDVATAQYSLPFTIALALYRDPGDPQAFLDGPNQNPAILELAKRVALAPYAKDGPNETRWRAGCSSRSRTAARSHRAHRFRRHHHLAADPRAAGTEIFENYHRP